MDGQMFADTFDVIMDVESHGHDVTDDGWEHNAYTVTLRHQGRSNSFDYKMGLSLAREPVIGEVIECLSTDYLCADMTFDEFCEEFGHNNDSRKDYALWESLKEIKEKIEWLILGNYPMLTAFCDVRED